MTRRYPVFRKHGPLGEVGVHLESNRSASNALAEAGMTEAAFLRGSVGVALHHSQAVTGGALHPSSAEDQGCG